MGDDLGSALGSGEGGGGGDYEQNLVQFQAAWLHTAAIVSSDGPNPAYSVWVKLSPSGSHNSVIWESDPQGDAVGYAWFVPDNLETIIGDADTGGDLYVGTTYATSLLDGQLHHILYAGQTDQTPTSANVRVYYIDGVKATVELLEGDGDPYDVQFNGREFFVGYDGVRGHYLGAMGDLWIADPGSASLLVGNDVPELTLRKFISAEGDPVDPDNFPSGMVLLSGDATAFKTNQGTGGPLDFVLYDQEYTAVAGLSEPGPIMLSLAALLGGIVASVHDDTNNVDISSDFEAIISVGGQIQQTGAVDYSLIEMTVTLTGSLTDVA
jgi:hypothetical protein